MAVRGRRCREMGSSSRHSAAQAPAKELRRGCSVRRAGARAPGCPCSAVQRAEGTRGARCCTVRMRQVTCHMRAAQLAAGPLPHACPASARAGDRHSSGQRVGCSGVEHGRVLSNSDCHCAC
jgi:hypothetical protein